MHWMQRRIRWKCEIGGIRVCRVSDRYLAHLRLLMQWVGGQGKVAETVAAKILALRKDVDWLPRIVMRPIDVPLDTIEKVQDLGRAVGSDAGYNIFWSAVPVVRFGNYCWG